jgi:hypothetical protein
VSSKYPFPAVLHDIRSLLLSLSLSLSQPDSNRLCAILGYYSNTTSLTACRACLAGKYSIKVGAMRPHTGREERERERESDTNALQEDYDFIYDID